MRTLILILELLADDHPPLGYTEEELARARSRKAGRKGGYEQSEEASVLQEPPTPCAAQSGGFVLTQAHKDILDERNREFEEGLVDPIPWKDVQADLQNMLDNDA